MSASCLKVIAAALVGLSATFGGAAHADDGKLLLTGGVTSIDGAAGGGLTPWAVTSGYGSEGQWGATAFATRVSVRDYSMNAYGLAASVNDRLELSLAAQDFDTRDTGVALGLPGLHLKQTVIGVKWHVLGDAVVDSDNAVPAIALGAESKSGRAGGLAPTLAALGAHTHGVDLYVSATKLFLAQSVLANLTLRATKANQNGLLGFGGAASQRLSVVPEASLAWLLRRTLAVGVEYRVKPNKLDPSLLGQGLHEDDWKDLFIAWAPNKAASLTFAWVDLGRIVPAVQRQRQTGGYLSLQLAY